MTNVELIQYYVNLLIVQYKRKSKAPTHIQALIENIMIFELIQNVKNAYSIDTSIGVQLDVLGKYIGLERQGFVALDEDYRFYLKFKIILNNSNASNKEIDDLLYEFFGTNVFIHDYQNMTIRYNFVTPDSDQVIFLKNNNLLPKPLAVGIDSIVAIPREPFVFLENMANGYGYGYLTLDDVNLEVNFGNGGIEDLTVEFGSGETNLEVDFDSSLHPATEGGRWCYLII